MRIIAFDVHRSLAQMTILENGMLRDAGKGDLDRNRLLRFAQALKRDDEIVPEATARTAALRRLLPKWLHSGLPR
jgi:transposase